MTNPFPELLAFGLLAHTLLRITLAAFMLKLGSSKFAHEHKPVAEFFESLGFKPSHGYIKVLGAVELIVGGMLLIGILTQIAAFITAIITFISLVITTRHPEVKLRKSSDYVLLFVIAISLVFTGAGLIAIDLPL